MTQGIATLVQAKSSKTLLFAIHCAAIVVRKRFEHSLSYIPHTRSSLVILELLKASGSTGLSAFLPPSTRTLATLAGKIPPQNFEGIPHLPLVEHWEDGDFSLREVMGASPDMSVRSWTLQLLQRYRFVIGKHRDSSFVLR